MIVGGAALNLARFIERSTRDVDILATGAQQSDGSIRLERPEEPLPQVLLKATELVARDLGLELDWLNTGPAQQWNHGLPLGLPERVTWRRFAGLQVGVVGRLDLIHFKLYAAADHELKSRHMQDLLSLTPTAEELKQAADWINEQAVGLDLDGVIEDVLRHSS